VFKTDISKWKMRSWNGSKANSRGSSWRSSSPFFIKTMKLELDHSLICSIQFFIALKREIEVYIKISSFSKGRRIGRVHLGHFLQTLQRTEVCSNWNKGFHQRDHIYKEFRVNNDDILVALLNSYESDVALGLNKQADLRIIWKNLCI
jgi:hypothetical protein